MSGPFSTATHSSIQKLQSRGTRKYYIYNKHTPGARHGVIAGEAITMQNVNLWDGTLHTLHLSEVSLQILTTETCMQTGF